MANRYTNLRPTTFDDIPLYQPNYEGLDMILGQQQQKHNLAQASLDALIPDALSPFQKEATEYQNRWASKIDTLPGLYQKSFREGNKELNKLIREAKKELTDPNSEFKHFANTKKQYLEGVKRIEEFHKKDPVKYNKQFAMQQLTQQLQGAKWGDFYDGGVKKNFSDPELTPYVDIQKDVIEAISKIKEGQDTELTREIEKTLGRGWIEKIKTESITPERIEQATKVLLQNPKYKDQLAVEQWYNTKDVNFEAREGAYKDELYKQRETVFNQLNNAENLDKAQLAQLQAQIGTEPDGIYGADTAKAIEDFKENYDERLTTNLNDPNFSATFKQQLSEQLVQKPYINTAQEIFKVNKVDKSLIVDQPYLTRLKISASRSNTQAMVKAMAAFVPEKEVDYLTTPWKAFSMDNFNKAKDEAHTTRDEAQANLKTLLTDKGVKNLFVKANNGVATPMNPSEISNSIRTAMGIQNKDIPLDQKISQYSALTGVSIGDATKQFNQITAGGLGKQFGDVYNAWYEADQHANTVDEVETSITKTYLENEGTDQLNLIKKEYKWDNLSTKEVAETLNESLKYSKVEEEDGNYYGYTEQYNDRGVRTGTKKTLLDPEKGANLKSVYTTTSAGGGRYVWSNTAKEKMRGISKGIETAVTTNPEYSKSMKSYDIQGGKDTQLAGYVDEVDKRFNNSKDVVGLVQELTGTSDTNFVDSSGNKRSVYGLKNFSTSFITKPFGNSLSVTGVDKDGNVFTQEFGVPNTHKERVDRAIMAMGVDAFNNKDATTFEVAANNWASSNAAKKGVPMFKAIDPSANISNTTSFIRDVSRPSDNIEMTTYGTPLDYRPQEGGNRYNIFLTKKPNGGKSYVATQRVTDGTRSYDIMIPIKGDQGYAHSDLEFLLSEINKVEMPRYFKKEVTLERVPKGTVVPEKLINQQVLSSIAAFNNLMEE